MSFHNDPNVCNCTMRLAADVQKDEAHGSRPLHMDTRRSEGALFFKLKDKRLSAVRQLSNRLVGSVKVLSTRLAGLTGILGE